MGKSLLFIVWLFGLVGFGFGQSAPLRLAPGDVVAVSVTNIRGFDGEYTVLSDGSISGVGFGRVTVQGKTLAETEKAITTALAKRVKNPRVEVVLKSEFTKSVFFVGSVRIPGSLRWQPGMTLQTALSQVDVLAPSDLAEVTLYRGAKAPQRFNYQALLRADDKNGGMQLQPGDVISVLPPREIRIWVLGKVVRSGEYLVREGSDLYEALTAAGGLDKGQALDSELTAVVRRGEHQDRYPAQAKAGSQRVAIQAGDTIVVEAPALIHVTIAGEVVQPGETVLREGSTLTAAIAAARGKALTGTLENVMVFRNGEAKIVNAANPDPGMQLQNNDLVVVQRAQKLVYALGNVMKPSAIVIPDGREYRVTDVLADAGGLSPQGTLRRVVLVRPDKDGKLAVKRQFNLDEFLKDGKIESNPVVQPGDILYFDTPKGVTGQALLQGVSAALLLQSFFRN